MLLADCGSLRSSALTKRDRYEVWHLLGLKSSLPGSNLTSSPNEFHLLSILVSQSKDPAKVKVCETRIK